MKLSDNEKEHVRAAERAENRLRGAWQLFTMFLSNGLSPQEALQAADAAMEAWVEYEDQRVIEYPEIKTPDFGEQMADSMKSLFDKLTPEQLAMMGRTVLPAAAAIGTGQVDAEFIPEEGDGQ